MPGIRGILYGTITSYSIPYLYDITRPVKMPYPGNSFLTVRPIIPAFFMVALDRHC